MADYLKELRNKKSKIKENIQDLKEAERKLLIIQGDLNINGKIYTSINSSVAFFNNSNDWKGNKKEKLKLQATQLVAFTLQKSSEVANYRNEIKSRREELEDDLDDICDDITELENKDIEEEHCWFVGGVLVGWNKVKNRFEKWSN